MMPSSRMFFLSWSTSPVRMNSSLAAFTATTCVFCFFSISRISRSRQTARPSMRSISANTAVTRSMFFSSASLWYFSAAFLTMSAVTEWFAMICSSEFCLLFFLLLMVLCVLWVKRNLYYFLYFWPLWIH